MPITDTNRIYDGFSTLIDGVDNGRSASILTPGYVYDAVNATFRGGEAESRPPFRDITLTFLNDPNHEIETTFRQEIFQGADFFRTATYELIVCSVGGRHFSIQVSPNGYTGLVREITTAGRNSRLLSRAYFCQANKYMIIQDNNSLPVIFDGSNARRSNGVDEVPVGGPMAFGQERLIVGRGRQFLAGDLGGSEKDAEIKFTETNFLNEGGAFGLAAEMGIVRWLKFLPQQDTATGQGELLVGADNGISSVFTSVPRDQWKQTQIQRVTLLGVGGTGDKNVVAINGDVWFRSGDGWRSYRQARAEINGWARVPLSTEMRDYFAADTPELLQYGSAIYFDNRLISTICPQRGNYRTVHLGMAALDFNPISSFGDTGHPAWDGIWNGCKPLQLLTGIIREQKRAFAFEWQEGVGNKLTEITSLPPDTLDTAPISRFITRSMSCGSPYTLRELVGGDIWARKITGGFAGRVLYSSEQDGVFYCWDTFDELAASTSDCAPTGCSPDVSRAESRPRIRMQNPPEGARLGTSTRCAYEHQVWVEWSGRGKIHKGRFHFLNIDENPNKEVVQPTATSETFSEVGLDPNWAGTDAPTCDSAICPSPFAGGIYDPDANILPATPATPTTVAAPIISAASAPGTDSNDATVTCDTLDADIFYRFNGGSWISLGKTGTHIIMSNANPGLYEFYATHIFDNDSPISSYDNALPFATTVATPSVADAFSPGDYGNDLTLTCATGGASIYYRLNHGTWTLLGPTGSVLSNPANAIPSVFEFIARHALQNDSAIATYDNSALGQVATPVIVKASAHGVTGDATITVASPAGAIISVSVGGVVTPLGTSPQVYHMLSGAVYAFSAGESQYLLSPVVTYDNNSMGTTATPVVTKATAHGTAGTATVTCATPASSIHFRYNGGAWIAYTGPIAMLNVNPSLYEFYASATGFVDSAIASYDNSGAAQTEDPVVSKPTAPGSSGTATVTCGTVGAAIWKRKNGGAWSSYGGPFTMSAVGVQDWEFYASFAGLTDSAIVEYDNSQIGL